MDWMSVLGKLAEPLVKGVAAALKAAGASEEEAWEAIREAAAGSGPRGAFTPEERDELRRRAAEEE